MANGRLRSLGSESSPARTAVTSRRDNAKLSRDFRAAARRNRQVKNGQWLVCLRRAMTVPSCSASRASVRIGNARWLLSSQNMAVYVG